MITEYNLREVPVTNLVIKYVEEMSSEQVIISLKIQGNNKVPLQPVNWIAGV